MGGYDPSKNIFEITDCRGMTISCSERNWYGKILGSRPFMETWLPIVMKAIRNPHFICKDSVKENRNVYYMFHQFDDNKYIKIVVRFGSNNRGTVISAFPTDHGKEGETVIWTRSNN
jgi:uncharacterized membrane protein